MSSIQSTKVDISLPFGICYKANNPLPAPQMLLYFIQVLYLKPIFFFKISKLVQQMSYNMIQLFCLFIIYFFILNQKFHINMTDKFQNVRQVTSPSSQNSPFGSSFVQSRMGSGNIISSVNSVQPTKLQFASNSNLMSSQASYSSRKNNNNNQFYTSQVSNSNIYGNNYSNLSQSSVKNFYKGLGILPQDRLRAIAKGFLKVYGSGNQLMSNDISKIQQIAHQQDSSKFQQDNETVKQLTTVLDVNMDKRVTEQDILTLCRKYLNCQKRPIVYTPMAQERLSVARRLFKQFDVQNKGYLTQKQVPNLLSQTYRSLGKAFQATQQDIRSWMKLADGDGDGHVTLVEYQRSIIRALKKQGIKIYQD